MLNKSYACKFRLILTPQQEQTFSQWAGCCRFLYNAALEHRKMMWDQYRKSVSEFDQSNALKEIKQIPGFEWFKAPPAQCLQQSLKNLARAYQSFFQLGMGYPRFKKKNEGDSLRFPDPKQFKLEILSKKMGFLHLPKMGTVKVRLSRPLVGTIRHLTISRRGKHWFVSFNLLQSLGVVENNQSALGIDRGVVNTLSTSKREHFHLPEKIWVLKEKIKKHQRRLRLKKKFSNNWRKHQYAIFRYFDKIKKIRHDWIHKVTNNLSQNHGLICLEDLKIQNMTRSSKGTVEVPGKNVRAKSGLNREILEQGWFELSRQLDYKTRWRGGYLVLVPPHGTSQTCPTCHHKSSTNRLTQSRFHCENCGFKEHADFVAAINILARGHRDFACGESVSGSLVEAGTSDLRRVS